MAQVSDWQTEEAKNTHLDELTLSGEGGLYTNKLMCAVKKKFDDVDGKLASVQGAYVFKGTKADMTALEAVTSPAVGDVYSVTALGGENYAWDGTAWDGLGTSDASVVHRTGDENISGIKTFYNTIVLTTASNIKKTTKNDRLLLTSANGTDAGDGAYLSLVGGGNASNPCTFTLSAGSSVDAVAALEGAPDGTLTWDGQALQTTSDARLKTVLSVIPDNVLNAWEDVQWGQFRFLDAVERKGKSARLHLGLIAQRVKSVFESRGLDACEYGILCHVVRQESEERPASEVWTVRYQEALAMEAACQRRRADRLEARLDALEARLDGND